MSCRPLSRRAAGATLSGMSKIRLGGMALANGVLVHGPTAWACAIRRRLARSRWPRRASASSRSGDHRRRFCAGRCGSQSRSRCSRSSAASCQRRGFRSSGPSCSGRRSGAPSPFGSCASRANSAQWLRSSPQRMLSIAPALLALRSSELAAYHGAEHVSIGTYEHGEKRAEGARALRRHLDRPADHRLRAGNVLAAERPPICAARRGPAAPSARSAHRWRSSPG